MPFLARCLVFIRFYMFGRCVASGGLLVARGDVYIFDMCLYVCFAVRGVLGFCGFVARVCVYVAVAVYASVNVSVSVYVAVAVYVYGAVYVCLHFQK